MFHSMINYVVHSVSPSREEEEAISTCVRNTDWSFSVNLYSWTTHILVSATTEVYYENKMFEIEPNFLSIFQLWEKLNWKYIYQLPRLLSADIFDARDKLIEAFTKYFQMPIAQRSQRAWFVDQVEAEMRDFGLNNDGFSKTHMLFHWAVNGDMHKISFWILAHLLHDQELMETETAPAIGGDFPDLTYLTTQYPKFDSIWHEILRLYTSNSMMRYVAQPTEIGGKLLKKNHNVLAPYRLVHYDPAVQGDYVETFDPRRFLKNKDLARSPSYKPFGIGQNLCPGRFLAKQVVFTLVAFLLHRSDILVENSPDSHNAGGMASISGRGFPRPDDQQPCIAAMPPRADDDIRIRCVPRSNK